MSICITQRPCHAVNQLLYCHLSNHTIKRTPCTRIWVTTIQRWCIGKSVFFNSPRISGPIYCCPKFCCSECHLHFDCLFWILSFPANNDFSVISQMDCILHSRYPSSLKKIDPLDLAFCNLSQVLQRSQSLRWKTAFELATVFEVHIICYNAHIALYKVCPRGVYHIRLWWSASERTGKTREEEEGRCVPSTVVPYSDMKGRKWGS